MRTAVITIVSGRQRHLERQQAALARSTVMPDLYIVVSMGDDAAAESLKGSSFVPIVEHMRMPDSGLPLAAARNRGALRGIRESADLLIFLDVDCIPHPDLVAGYVASAERRPDAVLSGAVGYLPEACDYDRPAAFEDVARFHEFRPRLKPGETALSEPRLFWSLSFAVGRAAWERIGGFDEDYVGYGGEDTDFGLRAERAGVETLWAGGAEAFHQYHPTSSPPIDHLDDILANGARFARRWGYWPMEGWLRGFEQLGLIEREPVTGMWSRVGTSS